MDDNSKQQLVPVDINKAMGYAWVSALWAFPKLEIPTAGQSLLTSEYF